MSAWLKENKKYLVAAILLILVASLGLHELHNINLLNRSQTTINYMCSEAFQSWLYEIESVEHVLKPARTNFDVKEAANYTFAAKGFANILDWTIEVLPRPRDFAEHAYNHLALAAVILHDAVSHVAASSTLRSLDDDILLRLGNLTRVFRNLLNLVGTVEWICYEIGPIRWLEIRGILTQFTDYCKQIRSVSEGISAKYL